MRVLLIDDHTLFRDALAGVLTGLDAEVRVFHAANADEARAAAAHYEDLDLVLLDLNLPGSQGMSLLVELRAALITVPVVVLSASERAADVRAALAAAAAGYIPKTASGPDMLAALRQVLAGEVSVPASLLAAVHAIESAAAPAPAPAAPAAGTLTPRQIDVLRLLGEGLSNKGIANRLGLTEGTIKLHVSAVMHALHARNRTETVLVARQLGLLPR
jgi:DNA-binding NarL/FixJ family response regulator